MTIQLFKPYIGEEEIKAVSEVLRSGWIGLGPKTIEFEKKFARYIGVEHAVALNSGTAALDMALKLFNIIDEDEVIVPTMTFVSTAHAVLYNQATPVFVDVDPVTLNMDLDDVARKITRKTKAIIPVHYSGRPVDIDRLKEIIGDRDIKIIEDCAHACGAEYKGKKCGSLGDVGCFSFHAVKNLAIGDGGVITLNNEKKADRAARLRWLGIDKGTWDRSKIEQKYWWEYAVDEIGLKCHMNDIMAAIAIVQLQKLDEMNFDRRKIACRYTAILKNIDGLETPLMDNDDYKSSWHIYCIKCKNGRRDELSQYLEKHKIITGVHYKPIHLYNCYGNIEPLPKAEAVFKEILSLPIHPNLKGWDIETVIGAILDFFNE